ncbi:MAG: transglutaminase family protein [Nitratireductor sp.]|nr:transglutaminase family protein [Nitratireductor sp.]MCC0020870.1 transglutaminase family protein [Nitratireductor sp.]
MSEAIRIVHTTRYRYARPVNFGEHQLMLRPRDGHDMRLVSSSIAITPPADLRWHFDTFGNSVATATFLQSSDILEIRSELLVRRYPHEPLLDSEKRIETHYPFRYPEVDRIDLAPYIALHNPLDEAVLSHWLDREFTNRPSELLSFLRELSETIHRSMTYARRDSHGTQSPAETISLGSGSCRDFAFLFMEAARHFGIAARFVSGYLNDLTADGTSHQGGGATHAWAEAYMPNEGWIEFDPTNLIVGSSELIRIAVTRAPEQAIPISGSFVQDGSFSFIGMEVDVQVNNEKFDSQAA